MACDSQKTLDNVKKINTLLEEKTPEDIAELIRQNLKAEGWNDAKIALVEPEIIEASQIINSSKEPGTDEAKKAKERYEQRLCGILSKSSDELKQGMMKALQKNLSSKSLLNKRNNLKALKSGSISSAIKAVIGGKSSKGVTSMIVSAASGSGGNGTAPLENPKKQVFNVPDVIVKPKASSPKSQKPANYSIIEDYPESYGFIDSVKNFFKINKKTKDTIFHHSSGSIIRLDKDGNVTIEAKGNVKQVIDKDYFLQVRGNMEVQVDGNYTETIKGNYTGTVNGSLSYTVDSIVNYNFNTTLTTNVANSIKLKSGADYKMDISSEIQQTTPQVVLSGDHYAKSYNS